MKRELLENNKVIPYTSGAAIDRLGFLSAIFAAAVTDAGTVIVAVTHCDTIDGTYAAVPDKYITLGNPASVDAESGDIVNIDIDLLGCKQFIKITASGATASYAVALGDAAVTPV